MGGRICRVDRSFRCCWLLPVPARIQAGTHWQAGRPLRPTCTPCLGSNAVHLRPAQGAPARIPQRPRRPRPLLYILGLPVLLSQLCAVHLRRFALAPALFKDSHRDRSESVHNLSGCAGNSVPARPSLGSHSALGLHAQPPQVRPDPKVGVCRHPRIDCDADGLHASNRGLLYSRRWHRFARGRPGRWRSGVSL